MPTGVVKWFDDKRGEGRIQSEREYPVLTDDMEPEARVPGARVHFDIDRRSGIDQAVAVRLREGTRVGKGQRRFGDLTGARHRADKQGEPLTHGRPERHPEVTPRYEHDPKELVRRWANDLAQLDLATLLAYYAPEVRLHAGSETLRGKGEIQRYLSNRSFRFLQTWVLDVRGDGEDFVAEWTSPGTEQAAERTRLRIEHGRIVEQWW